MDHRRQAVLGEFPFTPGACEKTALILYLFQLDDMGILEFGLFE